MVKNELGVSIIPEPVKVTLKEENFVLDRKSVILTDSKSKQNANFLKDVLAQTAGLKLKIKDLTEKQEERNNIILKVQNDEKDLNPEGYNLDISQSMVLISAPAPVGAFYGIQTLNQLISLDKESSKTKKLEWSIPCVRIEDYPRFFWRGYMLDEGRHFFGKDIVKRILDQMAFFKLNVFHWHLTEDQGWRIEIKKYPLLTKVGSKRKGTTISPRTGKLDGIPVSGYYLQKEIREIVRYAAERYITVVPEIEFPGHATAALASYPELSCTGGPFEVSTRFGVHDEVLCVGKEKAFDFAQNVLNEVMEIFPSEIIHIGGDEVPKKRWKECSECQARIKEEGIKTEEDLQVYFTNRVSDYLASRGRRSMGWNEILNDKLTDNAICQYWTANFDKVLEHMKKGRNIVMSEQNAVYLNYPYNSLPLHKIYEYEPVPDNLEPEFHGRILGIEACLWTEYVPNAKRLEWQTFPRLLAVAETGWTPKKKKDCQSFQKRLDSCLKRSLFQGVNSAPIEESNKESTFGNK